MTYITEKEVGQWQALKLTGISGREAAKKLNIAESSLRDAEKRLGQCVQHADGELKEGLPKIGLFDIETAPTVAYVWGRFKQYVSQDQVLNDSFILSYSHKWLGEALIHSEMTSKEDVAEGNDFDITLALAQMFDEADIIIAHNLLGFDEKVVNARMAYWGILPTSSYRKVDTLQIAKKNFRFPSNKLDALGEYLGLGRKVSHEGFSMWANVLKGDDEARAKMLEYNEGDVELLEKVYLALRPWDNKHPNVAQLYNDNLKRCPVCGSIHLTKTKHLVYTDISAFEEYQCDNCGKVSRGRTQQFTPEKRKSILANIRS